MELTKKQEEGQATDIGADARRSEKKPLKKQEKA